MCAIEPAVELGAFLAGIPFFAPLGEAGLVQLAAQLEPVRAGAGDVVITEGGPADGLYIVLSGRLRVSVAGRVLHDLGRGAVIGEVALLSHRPRSATVRAARDSELLLLRTASFWALVEKEPGFLAEMARLLIDRLLAVDRPQPTARNHAIAVAPAGGDPSQAPVVARALAAHLAATSTVTVVDAAAADRALGSGAAQRGSAHPDRGELVGWLAATERRHDHVVYVTDPDDDEWSRHCLTQADVVLLVGGGADTRLGPVEARALGMTSLRCELVRVEPPGAARAAGMAGWLASRPTADYHHLRDGRPADVARLARMVTGTACGVVLGGGGARGFAHLGVLRALEEAGVPVDIVGGTSIGAVMGALYALGLPDGQRVGTAVRAFTRSGSLINPTLPRTAVSSGRRVDRLLAQYLGDTEIEDMPVRYFCVSSSLAAAREVVHERGSLWRAVRASISLPGIYPPVAAGGDLLIDGGMLDNVPVAAMRDRVGDGLVIASDISPGLEPLGAAPSVFDILTRATALSSTQRFRAAVDSHHVDLLLQPPVSGVGILDFKAGARLIETGYRHAAEALARDALGIRRTAPAANTAHATRQQPNMTPGLPRRELP